MTGSILIVDDDSDTAMLMRDSLRKRGFDVESVSSAEHCIEHLRTHHADVVVTDVHMAGMSGLELCEELHQRHPDLLPIVLTGQAELDTVIAAIRAGAHDFLTKPLRLDALADAVSRALETLSVKRDVTRLGSGSDHDSIAGFAGGSPAIRETIEMVHRASNSDATVLITGESGTGKELVAQALHDLSSRRGRPFVAVNCAAMPEALLESELFGHLQGAFTDAKRARPGLFVQAAGGTIFLDEIGEMPIQMQVKLLRVLQARKVRPVGADEEVPFQARIVTATNRDLEGEVAMKRFREDLFYRINVVAISVPPLRSRGGDILVLAQVFLERFARRVGRPAPRLSIPATRILVDYDWPGNVRELENCIERAVALCRIDEVSVEDLPLKVRAYKKSSSIEVPSELPGELLTLDAITHRFVRQTLAATGGNKTHAARILGIDRRSLYRKLEEAKLAKLEAA